MANVKQLTAIDALWREHCDTPFPPGLAGQEVGGICVTSLDSFASGCIQTFLARRGSLDDERAEILRNCKQNLAVVIPHLKGEGQAYFARLERLVGIIMVVLADEE